LKAATVLVIAIPNKVPTANAIGTSGIIFLLLIKYIALQMGNTQQTQLLKIVIAASKRTPVE
jgi:hypothetical protein